MNIIPNVSKEAIRKALIRCGISYQRHRTWKHSNDPEFGNKWRRIKALYTECPKRSAVVCVDEFGPLECRPYMGKTWAKQGKVQRLPATFNRPHGVRHMFGFYDVHADVLGGFFYKRKRGEEFKDFLKQIRVMYPRWMRLYIVLDNFSPHLRKDVMAWAKTNRMKFIFTATNASWMNRIEAHFGALRKFALEGTFPQTHEQLQEQIEHYLVWRNSNRAMQPNEIRALIVDFNVRRMKAVSRKRPAQLKDTMNTEDEAVIEALIQLTPQSFDLPDLRWLPDEIIDFVKGHGLVQGVDKQWIKQALESSRPRRSF